MKFLANRSVFLLAMLLAFMPLGCARSNQPAPATQVSSSAGRVENADTLQAALRQIAEGVKADVSVAALHVESGKTIEVDGAKKLPLYSVFKLPLAITVLKEVEAGKLKLDQTVKILPTDVAPGSQYNSDLWRQPAEKTVAELIGFSIVRSDNTSTDKLLGLIGGPPVVTQQMRALGLSNIDVIVTSREFGAHRGSPNLGSTMDLVRLLAQLQEGKLLQPSNRDLLLSYMERARTGGERRLRANLPPGTQVAEKTGTGELNTNDAGLITLPDNKGHLAIAVLISNSKMPAEKQEAAIAEMSRAAYDFFVAQPTPK